MKYLFGVLLSIWLVIGCTYVKAHMHDIDVIVEQEA